MFSACGTYRYALTRHLSEASVHGRPGFRSAAFIGLNPSTADAATDDPTIRRCIQFATSWGFDRLVMANLFAFRATDPREMLRAEDPVGPANDDLLRKAAVRADLVLACWGAHGGHRDRDADVVRLIREAGGPPLHVLKLTKGGCPAHPLYLPKTLTPQEWAR